MPLITKSERIALMATKKELIAWKLCADEAGVSLSEWMRRASGTAVRPQGVTCDAPPTAKAGPVVP